MIVASIILLGGVIAFDAFSNNINIVSIQGGRTDLQMQRELVVSLPSSTSDSTQQRSIVGAAQNGLGALGGIYLSISVIVCLSMAMNLYSSLVAQGLRSHQSIHALFLLVASAVVVADAFFVYLPPSASD